MTKGRVAAVVDLILSAVVGIRMRSVVTPIILLDEDNMASDSATQGATQQSIKAYVDSASSTVDVVSNVAQDSILGRTTAGSGDSEELTATQVRTLINVEDGADVTDTANVTAAGALMDSEVTNLSQVKAFDTTDYATAAQGATADSALQNIVEDTTPQFGGPVDGQGNDLNNLGVVFLTEQAAAEADVAGKGQIWVKTATPNQLWFTDDAGTDTQLGIAAGLSNIVEDTSPQFGADVDTQGFDIRPDSDDDSQEVLGGSDTAASGLRVYGGSHATKAGDIELFSNTLIPYSYDASAATAYVNSEAAAGAVSVYGGADGNGSGILLFGASHATKANDIELITGGSTKEIHYDDSAATLTARHLFSHTPVAITGATTATINRYHTLADVGTPADYTVTLPAAGTAGRRMAFKALTGLTKVVTIDGASTETIGGQTTIAMTAGMYIEVEDNGTNWDILVWQKAGARLINRASTIDTTNRSTTSTSYVTSSVSVTIDSVTKGSVIKASFDAALGASQSAIIHATLYRSIDGAAAADITPSGVGELAICRTGADSDIDSVHGYIEDSHGADSGSSVEYILYFKSAGAYTSYIGRRGSDTTIDVATVMIAEEYI